MLREQLLIRHDQTGPEGVEKESARFGNLAKYHSPDAGITTRPRQKSDTMGAVTRKLEAARQHGIASGFISDLL